MDPEQFYRQKIEEQIDDCVERNRIKLGAMLGRSDVTDNKDPQVFAQAIMEVMDRKTQNMNGELQSLLSRHRVTFGTADAFRHVRNDVFHRQGKYTRNEDSFREAVGIVHRLSVGIDSAYAQYQGGGGANFGRSGGPRVAPPPPGPTPQSRPDPRPTPRPGPRPSPRPSPYPDLSDYDDARPMPAPRRAPGILQKILRRGGFAVTLLLVAFFSPAVLMFVNQGLNLGMTNDLLALIWIAMCALATSLLLRLFKMSGRIAITSDVLALALFWGFLGWATGWFVEDYLPVRVPFYVPLTVAGVIWGIGLISIAKSLLDILKLARR